MTYVEEISLALIRVLEHASLHEGVRLSGYAAKASYWTTEVRHALDCIEGYHARFERLKDARSKFEEQRGMEVDSAWVTPSIIADELAELKQRLLAAATRFFRLMQPIHGPRFGSGGRAVAGH
jgi:hypothetical protein